MPITEKQRLRRRNYIGSSDAASILGMNKYSNAKNVWITKRYEIETGRTNENMERGNYFESALLEFAASETGLLIAKNQFRAKGIFAANLDAQAYKKIDNGKQFLPIGFEAKTSKITDGWGEPGTEEVPEHVMIQCLVQFYVADLKTIFIPRIAPHSLKLELFRIDFNPEIESAIHNMVEILKDWWKKYVIGNIEPPNEEFPSLDIVKRIVREPGSYAEKVDTKLLSKWEKTKKYKTYWTDKEEDYKAALILQLGTSEGFKMGDRVLTFLEQNTKPTIDMNVLRNKYPEVYAEIATPNKTRVLRIKKG